ncbi:hypothetical protein VTK56DRAFT_8722 [Thermocarpiscus australiensis]
MEMDAVAEPARANDEPPSTELVLSPTEQTPNEHTDKMALPRSPSPSEEVDSGSLATQVPAQQDSVESTSINGINRNHQEEIEKSNENNEDLTPPPESPIEDTMSHDSSVPLNTLEDEIVVGTNANGITKPSLARATPESGDVEMGDAEEKPLTSHLPKRKRASGVYAESVGEKDDSPAPTEDQEPRRPIRPAKTNGIGGVKGVVIGFWRESPAKNDADKHAVIGFIDVRDRLRTRILPTTRDGRMVDARYPIPPGPGGSWVTFDKVAFDDHLVGLNHHVVKEFVKIRAENGQNDETPEEKAKLDLEAAELAAERVRNNPPPEAAIQPLVAYGSEIPDDAVLPNRPESKKRRLAGSFGVPPESPIPVQQPLDNIPGTRPTRILLGHWKQSSEQNPLDKHAVYGILGANDMFRVKLTRETRDGRPVLGNFPGGPGGLWIHWNEVEFEPHLRHLTRPEVKEYCRIRQRQLDDGETAEERIANETKAVYEAQQRVAQSISLGIPIGKDETDLAPIAIKGSPMANGNGYDVSNSGTAFLTARREEPHHLRRSENGSRAPPGPGVLERTHSLARREIARVEAAQARADLRAASREASLGPVPSNKSLFQDNVSRLNKVWAAQEANRIRAGGEDAKIYMGIKYERKQSGPFAGKLVSQGTIIDIDGEDYVEYRVLTKPTFF